MCVQRNAIADPLWTKTIIVLFTIVIDHVKSFENSFNESLSRKEKEGVQLYTRFSCKEFLKIFLGIYVDHE